MFSRFSKARNSISKEGTPNATSFPPKTDILDVYVMTSPSAQNAVDVFNGEWSSAFPVEFGINAGEALLFEDPRLNWGIKELGGVRNADILELGPLEGGHTFLLENQGANSVISVEANSRAYLKCLVTKEVTNLKGSFVLGDMNIFMDECNEKFDVCIASGVLYHQRDPVETIRRISKVAEKVYVWTHYFDARIIEQNDANRELFKLKGNKRDFDDQSVKYYKRYYKQALEWAGFCGGATNHASWMEKDDILKTLRHFGFEHVRVDFDQPDHANGPSCAIAAQKS